MVEKKEGRKVKRWRKTGEGVDGTRLSEIHFGKCFGKIFLKCQEKVELEKLTWVETKKKK